MLKYNNKEIDKDDCFYCFHTAFDDDGLFISTQTNKSYCSRHLPLHKEQFPNDTIYLNIQKHRKQKAVKETKMIKLEIKQESESELFELNYQLYEYKGSNLVKVDELDQETREIIDQIINSTSKNRNDELKSWQLDLQPCEHTIEFHQSPIKNLDLTKCAECELNENLWICLTCGKLGCGRAQFGGVPGNTHALQHFELTNHPIAVKLGSLSKKVADIYCYQCNEEIQFSGVASALHTFGIDLNNYVKTEKSLVELQIEQNVNWEFNLENENGEKLPSIFGPGLTGLKNLGNSCYLSSVSQVLFSLREYQERFYHKSLNESSDPLEFQLVKLANGLVSGDFAKPNAEEGGYQVGIAPTSFKRLIGENHQEFSSMKQQDAFEFWNYLLDKVDRVDPSINDIFRFITIDKLKVDTDKVKLKEQITENITIPIEIESIPEETEGSKYKRQDFLDALINYISPEEIEFDNKSAFKSIFIKTFPKYLISTVQRIKLENWVPIKTDVPLTLPESFDLKDFQAEDVLDDDEVEIHDDDYESKENGFTPNENALNNILQMGFPENRAKKALYLTGNNEDSEIALNWLFEHLEDPSIDDPIDYNQSNSSPSVDENSVTTLESMGFLKKPVIKALSLNNGDVEAAVQWLFSNPDDDGTLPETSSSTKDESKIDKLETLNTSSQYRLKAVICHKGTQVTSGHYVSFIKIDERWVLFNDEKVIDVTNDSKSWNEIERNGYVYIWESF